MRELERSALESTFEGFKNRRSFSPRYFAKGQGVVLRLINEHLAEWQKGGRAPLRLIAEGAVLDIEPVDDHLEITLNILGETRQCRFEYAQKTSTFLSMTVADRWTLCINTLDQRMNISASIKEHAEFVRKRFKKPRNRMPTAHA